MLFLFRGSSKHLPQSRGVSSIWNGILWLLYSSSCSYFPSRIQHDNTGLGAGWFLDRIVVTDLKNPRWKYYFPCGQWLARDEGDGQICRDLVGSKDPLAIRKSKLLYELYTIAVHSCPGTVLCRPNLNRNLHPCSPSLAQAYPHPHVWVCALGDDGHTPRGANNALIMAHRRIKIKCYHKGA